MNRFLQAVVDAIGTGSLYSLIALGIALVFGVMRLVNVAYGEIVIGSIYCAYFLRSLPWYGMVAGMVIAAIVISLLIERLAFRPLRRASPTTMLIASFAVSYTLQNLALATVGSSPKGVSTGSFLATAIKIGPIRTPGYSVVTVAAVIVIVVALRLFLVRTSTGISMRAAAEDFQCARLLGVKANSIILVAFILSGAIAAVVGYLLASSTGSITPTSGTVPTLIGFTAVVLGGLGSLPAAALGGLLVGALTIALQYLLPNTMLTFRDAFLYAGVLLLLLWRPQGLFVRRSATYVRV